MLETKMKTLCESCDNNHGDQMQDRRKKFELNYPVIEKCNKYSPMIEKGSI